MTVTQKRLLGLALSLPVLVVGAALIYMGLMWTLEGQRRDFWSAVSWAAETITTTGYGSDSRWTHPVLVLFVVGLQFLGVFLVFLVIPILLIPFLEERFETRLPRELTRRLDGHVVVYRHGPAVENLLLQLKDAGIETVILEEDELVARRLVDAGRNVVFSAGDQHDLSGLGLESARAFVANGSDVENAGVILSARQKGFTGEVIALVEEPVHRKPMALAGASAVYTPRHVLAAALAARASDLISPRLAGIQQLGPLEVREIRVREGSSIAGRTLEEAAIGARTGAVAIGQWVGGRLVTPLTARTRLAPRSILVVVGTAEAQESLASLCLGSTPLRREGFFLVAGYGEVGRKVHQLLNDVGEEVRVLDQERMDGVDIVGDVLDATVLERVEIHRARSVVLALNSDDATLFGTVVVQEAAPEAPVIARVNHAANVERIHRAGADFALSIAQVSGQILARRLLGEEAVSVDPQLRLLRVEAGRLAGGNLATLAIRVRTGCSIVAVERGDEVLVQFPSDFRFEPSDGVYLAGDQTAINSFRDTFGRQS